MVRDPYRTGGPRVLGRVLVGVVVLAAVAGGAFALGRGTAPQADATTSSTTPAQNGAGGMPAFAHTPEGAQAAAAWLTERLYDLRGTDPAAVVDAWRPLVAHAGALDQVQRLVSQAGVTPVPRGSVTRAAVVGVRQQSYDSDRADIGVWYVLVYGAQTATPGPEDGTQRWGSDVVSVQWDGGWKLSSVDQGTGAAPLLPRDELVSVPGVYTRLFGAGGDPDKAWGTVPDGR